MDGYRARSPHVDPTFRVVTVQDNPDWRRPRGRPNNSWSGQVDWSCQMQLRVCVGLLGGICRVGSGVACLWFSCPYSSHFNMAGARPTHKAKLCQHKHEEHITRVCNAMVTWLPHNWEVFDSIHTETNGRSSLICAHCSLSIEWVTGHVQITMCRWVWSSTV